MKDIVSTLMTHQNQMKLFHWKTSSYARHKALDDYLENIAKEIDAIVENLMGSRDIIVDDKFSISFKKLTEDNVMDYLSSFRVYLTKDFKVKKDETGVLSLRDNLLVELDRLMYLFRLI